MLENALNLAGGVLYLASAIGALGCVGLYLLPTLYSDWIINKHQMDLEGELYSSVVDALEKAEGRPLQITIKEDEV